MHLRRRGLEAVSSAARASDAPRLVVGRRPRSSLGASTTTRDGGDSSRGPLSLSVARAASHSGALPSDFYGGGSSSSDGAEEEVVAPAEEDALLEEVGEDTELIFRLERRGIGWGEEMVPHVVVEHRRINTKAVSTASSTSTAHSRRGQTSGNSKYIQLEDALLSLDLTEEEANEVIKVAVAWRVTEGGLVLVDRRRRTKALRNVRTLVPFLENLGVPAGKDGVGALVAKVPLLILCNVEGTDNWDKRAVQVAAHWFLRGDFAPESASGDLKRWIHRVRRHKAQGKLSTDQVKLLELLGFDFGLGITEEWENMFDRLLDHILEYGHSQPMPSEGKGREITLHEWTEIQRIAYAAGRLASDHVERLESINFDWRAKYISRWLRYYQDYRALRADEGTLRVAAPTRSAASSKPDQALFPLEGRKFWRQKQQVLWYTQAIWPERRTMLREITFDLDPYASKFNEVCGVCEALQNHHKVSSMLELLVRVYDDLMVPQHPNSGARLEPSQARQLARWMKIQLVLVRDGMMLDPAKRARLQALGMQWEGLEWQMNFETLLKFRAVNGHCDVPKDHKLSAWVVNMRQNRHDLPFEYKNLLDMAGFTWERRGAWARMFAQLASFREENGHVLVPRQSTDHLHNHLGAWLVNQRALWRMGKLTGQQISRLQGIGVEL